MLVEAENQESRIELPYYSNTDYLSIITFAILFFDFSFYLSAFFIEFD